MTNPTTPDFRTQCVELLAAIQLYTGLNPAASEMSSVEKTEKLMDAMAATAAALATSPPKPPTDEELDEFVVFWWGAYTDESTVTDVIEDDNMADFARAALERWGK